VALLLGLYVPPEVQAVLKEVAEALTGGGS
jgi:hypothetical protein